MTEQHVTTMSPEDCAERAFYYAMLSNEAKAEARHGSNEHRAAYRKQARRMEEMVGIWMAIRKAKADPYPGFPQEPCPTCGGSTKEPHRRWPFCPMCNAI